MSRKVVINKLMLDKSLVGYRFDIMDEGNRKISFDLQKSIAKAFLSLLDRNNVYKGKLINGSLHDGRYLTDNEEDVVEIVNKNQAVKALRDYYYCADEQSIEDLLESDFGNQVDKLDNEEYKFILSVAVELPQSVGRSYIDSYRSLSNILTECSMPYSIFADRSNNNGFIQYKVGSNASRESLLSVVWEYFRRGRVLHTELYIEGKSISIPVGDNLPQFLNKVNGCVEVSSALLGVAFLGDDEVVGVFFVMGTITVTKGTDTDEIGEDSKKWSMKLGNIEDDGSMNWEELMVEIPPKDPTVLEVIDLFMYDSSLDSTYDSDRNLMFLSCYRPWYFRVDDSSQVNWNHFDNFCNTILGYRLGGEVSQNIEKNLNTFYPYRVSINDSDGYCSYTPEYRIEVFDYTDSYLSKEVYSFPKVITSLISYILDLLDLNISTVKDDFYYQGFNLFYFGRGDKILFSLSFLVSHKERRYSAEVYGKGINSLKEDIEYRDSLGGGPFDIKGISEDVVLNIASITYDIMKKEFKGIKEKEYAFNISVLRSISIIDKKVYKQDFSALRKFFANKKPSIFERGDRITMAFMATSSEFEKDVLDWSNLIPIDKTIKIVDMVIDNLKTEFIVTEKNVPYLEGSPIVNKNIFCKYSVLVKNSNEGISNIYGFETKLPLIVRRVFECFDGLFTGECGLEYVVNLHEYAKNVKCYFWRLCILTVERNSTGLWDLHVTITSLPKLKKEFKYSFCNIKLDDLFTTEYLENLFIENLFNKISWDDVFLYSVSLLPIVIKNSSKIFNTSVSKISFVAVSCIRPNNLSYDRNYSWFCNEYYRSDYREFVGTTGKEDIVYILFPKSEDVIKEYNSKSIFEGNNRVADME